MRTLLRQVSTGAYLRGPDQWTTDPSQALDFEMIDRALRFAKACGLHDVELAFAFTDSGRVTSVPFDKLALNYSEG